IAFAGPGVHDFAVLLGDLTESLKGTVELDPGFLFKLSCSCSQTILAFLDKSLRNGPGSLVVLLPERPAWMREKHLEALIHSAIEQDSSAVSCHNGRLSDWPGFSSRR